MAPGDGSVRLFVAAELPAVVVEALTRWRPRDPALRPLAPEALHLTLAFLGWRAAEDGERVGALLPGLARPVDGLALGEPRWLPPRRPRVLAVDVEDPAGALAGLQADVVGALADAVGFEPERRAYLAHVTVMRVRSGMRAPRLDLAPPRGPAPFAAPALTLFRSHLARGGARYEALARVALS